MGTNSAVPPSNGTRINRNSLGFTGSGRSANKTVRPSGASCSRQKKGSGNPSALACDVSTIVSGVRRSRSCLKRSKLPLRFDSNIRARLSLVHACGKFVRSSRMIRRTFARRGGARSKSATKTLLWSVLLTNMIRRPSTVALRLWSAVPFSTSAICRGSPANAPVAASVFTSHTVRPALRNPHFSPEGLAARTKRIRPSESGAAETIGMPGT